MRRGRYLPPPVRSNLKHPNSQGNMNKSLWLTPLSTTTCPPWVCPRCGVGTISLVPNLFVEKQTAESEAYATASGGDDPEFYESTFYAFGRCGHQSCQEWIGIIGKGTVETELKEGNNDEPDYDYISRYTPVACHPMPPIIVIPEHCPELVRKQLQCAFAIFWRAEESCAGRIRVALDYLLDHLKIQRKKKTDKGKFHTLDLHGRILLLKKTHPVEADLLMGIKFLGNAGSHGQAGNPTVSRADLLDAFEMLENVLDEFINYRSKKLRDKARNLMHRFS
jgi:Domain of unknown function (DUF4145)